jgi:hypothetical protein
MLRYVMCLCVTVGMLAARAHACEVSFVSSPTVLVTSDLVAASAVQVAPLAVQVDAFALQAAPVGGRVLTSHVVVRSCIAPRVRAVQRPARSRVTVRVR